MVNCGTARVPMGLPMYIAKADCMHCIPSSLPISHSLAPWTEAGNNYTLEQTHWTSPASIVYSYCTRSSVSTCNNTACNAVLDAYLPSVLQRSHINISVHMRTQVPTQIYNLQIYAETVSRHVLKAPRPRTHKSPALPSFVNFWHVTWNLTCMGTQVIVEGCSHCAYLAAAQCPFA